MFHVSEHEEFFFFKKSPAGLVQLSIFVFLKKPNYYVLYSLISLAGISRAYSGRWHLLITNWIFIFGKPCRCVTDSHQIMHLITLDTSFEVQYILCIVFLYAHTYLYHLFVIFNMLITPTQRLQHFLKYINPFAGDFQRGSSTSKFKIKHYSF